MAPTARWLGEVTEVDGEWWIEEADYLEPRDNTRREYVMHGETRLVKVAGITNPPDALKLCAAAGVNHKNYTSTEAKMRAVCSTLSARHGGWLEAPKVRRTYNPSGDGRTFVRVDQEHQEERQEHQERQEDSPVVEAESADVPTPNAGADALAAALAGFLAGSLDENKVRAIAIDVVNEQLRDMPTPVMRVEIAGREMVELSGTLHHDFPRVLKLVNAGLHVFLTGMPGTGKTTLCRNVADAMGVGYRELACHPQMTAVSLSGYMGATGSYVRTDFRDAWEYGHLFLLTEVDNGNGGIVAMLNSALANGHFAFADGIVERHKDCRIMVDGNTFGKGATEEFSGRNKLDAATLDRLTYWHVALDEKVEEAMVLAEMDDATAAMRWLAKVRVCRMNADAGGIKPRVFVTPRSSRDGARMLQLGFTEYEAVQAKFGAGLSEDVWRKVTAGVRFDGAPEGQA